MPTNSERIVETLSNPEIATQSESNCNIDFSIYQFHACAQKMELTHQHSHSHIKCIYPSNSFYKKKISVKYFMNDATQIG